MSIVLLAGPDRHLRHRAARPEADRRVWWTACGIRFAWVEPPTGRPSGLPRCGECWD